MNRVIKQLRIIGLCTILAFSSIPENVSASNSGSTLSRTFLKLFKEPAKKPEQKVLFEDGVLEEDNIKIENKDDEAITSEFFFVDSDDEASADAISDATVTVYKEFEDEVEVDGFVISAHAPEGIIPDGSKLSVKKVAVYDETAGVLTSEDENSLSQQEAERISGSVEELRKNNNVAASFTFDICIVTTDGEEIQPNGDVDIKIAASLDTDRKVEAAVYHVSEEENAELINSSLESINGNSEVSFATDSFSWFVVEFTYSEYTYRYEAQTGNDVMMPLSYLLDDLHIPYTLNEEKLLVDNWSSTDTGKLYITRFEGSDHFVVSNPVAANAKLTLVIDGNTYVINVVNSTSGSPASATCLDGDNNVVSSYVCVSGTDNGSGSCLVEGGDAESGYNTATISCTCLSGDVVSISGSTAPPGESGVTTCPSTLYVPKSTVTKREYIEFHFVHHTGRQDARRYLSVNYTASSDGMSLIPESRTIFGFEDECPTPPTIGNYTVEETLVATFDNNLGESTDAVTGNPGTSEYTVNRIKEAYDWEDIDCENGGTFNALYRDGELEESAHVTLPNGLSREGYSFFGWSDDADNSVDYAPGANVDINANKTFYAVWGANASGYTISNASSIAIPFFLNGNSYTVNGGESVNVDGNFGDSFALNLDDISPAYYTGKVVSSDNGVIEADGLSVSGTLGNGEHIVLDAVRKTKNLTFNIYNDNGTSVTNSITVDILDNVSGDEVLDAARDSDFATGTIATKQITVEPNSSATLTFALPENVNYFVSATNDAGQGGFSNSANYRTIIETEATYADTKPEERVAYFVETGSTRLGFAMSSPVAEQYADLLDYDTLVIDNQYQRASAGYISDFSISAVLFECLDESCLTQTRVGDVAYNDASGYFYRPVQVEAADGHSVKLGSLSGQSNSWMNQLDKNKTYKIVQESLVPSRYFEKDSGSSISAVNYDGGNTGSKTISLNNAAHTTLIEGSAENEIVSGSTFTTGQGGSLITCTFNQKPIVLHFNTNSSDGPLSEGVISVGVDYEGGEARQGIIEHLSINSNNVLDGSESGHILNPGMNYTAFLNGEQDSSSEASDKFKTGLVADSWDDAAGINLGLFSDSNEANLEVDLFKDISFGEVVLKAKADIGYLNSAYSISIDDSSFNSGTSGENGAIVNGEGFVVMHLGSDEYGACSVDNSDAVCLDEDGYYTYKLTVPTGSNVIVTPLDGMQYYTSSPAACGADCTPVTIEEGQSHIFKYDFTRKMATLDVSSRIDNVFRDRDIISEVKVTLSDTQNNEDVCSSGDYCEAWNPVYDFSNLDGVSFKDGVNTIEFTLNPETGSPDSKSFSLPAGLAWNISATAKENGSWISNFLNGLFGNNAGYSTSIASGGSGILDNSSANFADIVINSYQYARVNISSSKGATIHILDKNNEAVGDVTFADDNPIAVDLAYDLAPYTFKVDDSIKGYYTRDDVVLSDMAQDGIYDVNLKLSPIVAEAQLYANKGGERIHADAGYCYVGVDENNIIASKASQDGLCAFGLSHKLSSGTEYKVYFGGNLSGTNISDYAAVGTLSIPESAPVSEENVPFAEGVVELKKVTTSVSGIKHDEDISVVFDVDTIVSYNGLDETRVPIEVSNNSSKTIWLPVDSDYSFTVSDVYGYKKTITHDKHLNEAVDDLIDIKYDAKSFVLRITAVNEKFNEVKVAGVDYLISSNRNDPPAGELAVISTNNDGITTLRIPYDEDWIVVENDNVTGYENDDNIYDVSVGDDFRFYEDYPDNPDYVDLLIEKIPKKYSLEVTAKESLLDKDLEGAEFTLYDKVTDEALLSGLTNEEGLLVFNDLHFGHDYYVKTTGAPFGYLNPDAQFDVPLPENNDFSKPVLAGVVFEPMDILVFGTVLNSEFDDVHVDGVKYKVVEVGGGEISTFESREGGFVLSLPYGREYKIVEYENVYGYQPDGNEYPIVVDSDFNWQEGFKVDIKKVPLKYSAKVIATNSVFGTNIDGAEFTVYDPSLNTAILTGLCENGEIEFQNLNYGHNYYILVSKSPFGYIDNYNRYSVELPEGYDFASPITVPIALEPHDINVKVVTQNAIYHDVKVKGVEYTIVDRDGNHYDSKLSNGYGEASFTVKYGPSYAVIETGNVWGYQEDTSGYTVQIPGQFDFARSTISIVVNKVPLRYDLSVTSSSSVFGDKLADIEYSLYDRIGNRLVGKTISDENGNCVFRDLPFGHDYYIKQSSTLFGYKKDATDYNVVLPENYDFEEIIEKDIYVVPYKINIHITSVNGVYTDVPVQGVVYSVIAHDGTVAAKGTTDKNGIVDLSVDFGRTYRVEESDHPFGYLKDEKKYPIVTSERYNFEKDKNIVNIRPEPVWYEIPLLAKDDNNNPVAGAMWTIWDKTLEEKNGEAVIAQYAKDSSTVVSNEYGEAVFTVPEGHNYYISHIVPVGYADNKTILEPKRPSNVNELVRIGRLDSIDNGHKFVFNVSSNVPTIFHLFKNGKEIYSRNGDGTFELTYSQGDVNAYTVSAETPYGYRNEANAKVNILSNAATRVVSADNINFQFVRSKIQVPVTNIVPRTVVNIYDAYTNELVDSITADSREDVTFSVPWSQYYVQVVWPSGYARNNNSYTVDISGLDYGAGNATAPKIVPTRYTIEGEGVIGGNDDSPKTPVKTTGIVGIEISARRDGEFVPGGTYNVYYRGTESIAEDINKTPLKGIPDGRYYLSSYSSYDVVQVAVPDGYVLDQERKAVSYNDSITSGDVSTIYSFAQVLFNNKYTERKQKIEDTKVVIRDVCSEQREKLISEFSKYNESDYSAETWANMVQIYEQAMRELDTYCGTLEEDAEQEKEIVYTFDTSFSTISQLEEVQPDAKKSILETIASAFKGHVWPWLILAIGIIALVINFFVRKLSVNIIVSVGALILGLVILLLKDRGLLSILFAGGHLVGEIAMIVMRLLKDRDDYEEEFDLSDEE